MNRLHRLKPWLGAAFSLACITASIYVASLARVAAADTKPDAETKAEKKPEKKVEKKAEKKKLSGADLYAIHCNRCHPERYPTERTQAQWKTIMLHMRVRANLPAAQAKTIARYLQEEARN
jgi:aspartate/glutamate racemase